ncbi:ATP-grasp ribosomal peptide maturase [Streptomyces sp. NPDC056480]|uniref:ATP-grasp ribosomal peptide maturase n=1 Tax=Streptomyces sp. NPDC056480 TaxID=3345833 RepID=UPI0036C48712
MSISSNSRVLILTCPADSSATLVTQELDRRGVGYSRCNPGDFPQSLRLRATLDDQWVGFLEGDGEVIDLSAVGCVYYRRPTKFEFASSMSNPEKSFANSEARMGFGGVLSSMTKWVNHPAANAHAQIKPVHLAVARTCELTVPPTLVTNDPVAAQQFARKHGKIIYKTLSTPSFSDEGKLKVTFSTVADEADLDNSVSLTAHLFQKWVDKEFEVRLTVVDEDFFAARIDASSAESAIDWRSDYESLSYSVVEVPSKIRSRVGRMMGMLSLRFATMDFIVSPSGEWNFVDLNPNGQWGWIEKRTQMPISSALADALTA